MENLLPSITAFVRLGLLLGLCAASTPLAAEADDVARARLRQLLEGSREGAATRPNSIAPGAASERSRLLEQAEASLARGEIEYASETFERAAAMLHAADAELGIVRTLMQAGRYRHALAYAAHTAGAHPDTPAGTGLYAWLLHLGGHVEPARQTLSSAQMRQTDAPVLKATSALMDSPDSGLPGVLLAPPARYAPYSLGVSAAGDATDFRAVASGYLLADGTHAVTDQRLIRGASRVAVRNGLGQLVSARVVASEPESGIALLALASPMRAGAGHPVAPREPYPGSMAYAVRFPVSRGAEPGWPKVHGGFLGGPSGASPISELGIELPSENLGGPVFDAAGRFIGLAVQREATVVRVGITPLQKWLGAALLGHDQPANERQPSDAIYERALGSVLQVLAF